MMRCQECRVLHNTPQEASDCRYRDLLKAEARRAAIAECVAVLEAEHAKRSQRSERDTDRAAIAGMAKAIEIVKGLDQ